MNNERCNNKKVTPNFSNGSFDIMLLGKPIRWHSTRRKNSPPQKLATELAFTNKTIVRPQNAQFDNFTLFVSTFQRPHCAAD